MQGQEGKKIIGSGQQQLGYRQLQQLKTQQMKQKIPMITCSSSNSRSEPAATADEIDS